MGWAFIENYENSVDVNTKLSTVDTRTVFCTEGQRFDETKGLCVGCPYDEFQDVTNHTRASCQKHKTSDYICGGGEYFDTGKYKNLMQTRKNSSIKKTDLATKVCTPHNISVANCDTGTTYFDKSEYNKLGNGYIDSSSLQTKVCLSHGEYNSEMCDDNTYLSKTNDEVYDLKNSTKTRKLNKSDLCEEQLNVVCQDGSYLSNEYAEIRKNHKSGPLYENTAGVCKIHPTFEPDVCADGKYFDNAKFNTLKNYTKDRVITDADIKSTVCTPHATCPNGKQLVETSTTSPGSCQDCPSGSFKNSGQNRNSCDSKSNTCRTGSYLSGYGSDKTLNDPICSVDCTGNWNNWGNCSAGCGNGTHTRTYSITKNAAHNGRACPHPNGHRESRNCKIKECPVNCVGAWTSFGTCSKSCGGGTQSQTYSITRNAAHGGANCPHRNGQVRPRACNNIWCDTKYHLDSTQGYQNGKWIKLGTPADVSTYEVVLQQCKQLFQKKYPYGSKLDSKRIDEVPDAYNWNHGGNPKSCYAIFNGQNYDYDDRYYDWANFAKS
jgi:hypothetical protein